MLASSSYLLQPGLGFAWSVDLKTRVDSEPDFRRCPSGSAPVAKACTLLKRPGMTTIKHKTPHVPASVTKADHNSEKAIETALNAGPLTQGASGPAVNALSRLMNAAGYKVGDAFDGKMTGALKQFQEATGQAQTGSLDASTYTQLKNLVPQVRQNALDTRDAFVVQGQKSGRVARDQKALQQLGYSVGNTNGVLDAQTSDAIRRFRRNDGVVHASSGGDSKPLSALLQNDVKSNQHAAYRARVAPSNGQTKADDVTTSAAKAITADGTIGIGQGSARGVIRNVQRHLVAAGFDPKLTNGVWTPRTGGEIKAFQERSGLMPTGRVDGATWNKLKSSFMLTRSATSPVQSLNERDGAVAKTEQQLKSLGYKVRTDGLFDMGTQRAVEDFQRKHGIGPSGWVGDRTEKALKSATSFSAGSWKPGPGTLRGADSSHWTSQAQFENGLRGAKYSIIAASDGQTYVDPTFSSRWAELGRRVKSGQMTMRVAYHFMEGGDGVGQAKHFLNTVGVHGKLPAGTRLALDWESSSALADPGALRDCASYIHQVTGVWPICYTMDSQLGRMHAAVPQAPQWDAHPGAADNRNIPFFQSSFGEVTGLGYDQDEFNGSEAALRKFAGYTS
jgi:peptidoglycan hydrolase-like protein with peptidoglycan-binding domain